MIKCVFFDLDDTLHDSSRLARLARRAALHMMISKGLPVSLDEGYSRLVRIVKEKGSNYPGHYDLLTEEIVGKRDYKLVSAGIIGYHNTKFAMMQPFSDTLPTLIELKKMDLALNILTNGRAVKQWEKVLRLGLESFFDNVIISEVVGHSKPDPEIYKSALDIAGCAPGEALFVDNSLACITGAKQCGIKTVLMNRERQQAPSDCCDIVIDSLSQLPEAIESFI